MYAAAQLSAILRTKSLKSILRQDIKYFDREENSVSLYLHPGRFMLISLQTGSLTSGLSDGPQKISRLAGLTLGAILQGIASLFIGVIIGLAFAWKVALVGLGLYFIFKVFKELRIPQLAYRSWHLLDTSVW